MHKSDKVTGKMIRSGPLRCFEGENEMELIAEGDFKPLNRSDCMLRFDEVLRWAWESWRSAVGTKIGQIYSYAIAMMNVGAQSNGEY